MRDNDKVSLLLVDDQPAKLISLKAILTELGETLLSAGSARQALELLLKHEDIAVVLIDVCMPETDGFELAALIREHPRFQKTAIIFISAILLTDVDRLRGYEMGAVDYVPVPVIPEMLRAKVKVFVELYRKTRQLEQLNRDLEARVAERTAELAASTRQLRLSEQLRSLALAAGQMGSWEWNLAQGAGVWDEGQHKIFGVDPDTFVPTPATIQPLVQPEDYRRLRKALRQLTSEAKTYQTEFRVRRPSGEIRWCLGAAAASFDAESQLIRLSGVTVDITERKRAEERQMLLAEEVDHRARNVVAVVQSIMRLTRAESIKDYVAAVDGRVSALSNAHKLLARSRWEGADLDRLVDEEFAPYRSRDVERVGASGPAIMLPPATAQTIALALHELATNAVKYGALSRDHGCVRVTWQTSPGMLELRWVESDGPRVAQPTRSGYGTRVVKTSIEDQLGGSAIFDWNPEGLRCTLSVPFDERRDAASRPMLERRDATPRPPPERRPVLPEKSKSNGAAVAGKLILLVEDEPMVSMMLEDMLSDFGHTVDGPYTRFSDALRAATNNNVQAGILDINLRGEKIYPIADLLLKRKIPFIFLTGYSVDSIDPRFTHVPVLQKPIEPQKLEALLSGGLAS